MKVTIIIPTYNERENIVNLLSILDRVIKSDPSNNYSVLVVDANSPDGTSKLVEDFGKNHKYVNLLTEKEKKGLGGAYFEGFKYAIEKLGAEIVVEMDADFQHDPNDVPKLVRKINEGYDYVIGSRFTKGGSIPKEWALYRKILSIGGNYFSKLVLGIYNVSDFTSGFKASKVEGFVDSIDFTQVLSKGFAYKIDLLFKMHRMGAKIIEVPIAFGLRDRGDSKMEHNNFLDSLMVVIKLRMFEKKNFVKFLVVGFIGFFTDTTLSNIFRFLNFFAPNIATTLAATISMLVTYTLNNFWSFKDRKFITVFKLLKNSILYFSISLVPITFRYFFVGYVVKTFGNTFIHFNLALLISIFFGLVWNYTFYSRVVWKKVQK